MGACLVVVGDRDRERSRLMLEMDDLRWVGDWEFGWIGASGMG